MLFTEINAAAAAAAEKTTWCSVEIEGFRNAQRTVRDLLFVIMNYIIALHQKQLNQQDETDRQLQKDWIVSERTVFWFLTHAP